MHRLIVHSERCAGHGRCYVLAPALLSDDDEGYPSVQDSYVEVPNSELEAARSAVSGCPEQAVELLSD